MVSRYRNGGIDLYSCRHVVFLPYNGKTFGNEPGRAMDDCILDGNPADPVSAE